jgi:hypothetical protein
LSRAYLRGVDWEPPDALERRAARLLPAFLLARIDGKSPVEYITDETSKDAVSPRGVLASGEAWRGSTTLYKAWQSKTQPVRHHVRRTDHPHITPVVGRRVWDSRGRPTVRPKSFWTTA